MSNQNNYAQARLAIYLLLADNGKLLLSRRQNTGFADGMYTLPSGHVEAGESFTAALVREANEELGIEVKEFTPITTMLRNCGEGLFYVDAFFECISWGGNVENMEPLKCDDLRWFTTDSLPHNLVPSVARVLSHWQANQLQPLSEFGWR